jgi:hypothetical protein
VNSSCILVLRKVVVVQPVVFVRGRFESGEVGAPVEQEERRSGWWGFMRREDDGARCPGWDHHVSPWRVIMNDDDWGVADFNRGEGVNVLRVEVLPYCIVSSPRVVAAERSGREEMKVVVSKSVSFPFLCSSGGLDGKAVYLGHVCRSSLKEVKEGSRCEADGRREAEREAAVGGFAAVGEDAILAVVVFQEGACESAMAPGLVGSDGEGARGVDERGHVVLLLLLFLIISLQL